MTAKVLCEKLSPLYGVWDDLPVVIERDGRLVEVTAAGTVEVIRDGDRLRPPINALDRPDLPRVTVIRLSDWPK